MCAFLSPPSHDLLPPPAPAKYAAVEECWECGPRLAGMMRHVKRKVSLHIRALRPGVAHAYDFTHQAERKSVTRVEDYRGTTGRGRSSRSDD